MSKIGIYPGTFDPMTNGHLNIIQRSLKVVDKLIIGVADNLNKKPLLSINERKNIIANDIHSLQQNNKKIEIRTCLLYTSPSPRDLRKSRMPSSA